VTTYIHSNFDEPFMMDFSEVPLCKESIRVLVVDDHHMVRQGLVSLLNVADDLEVVGEAADGVEAITQFRKRQPDITLIDLRMPRLSGVEVIERIRMETPNARFIVLTTYDGDEDIYRALQAGARAYLLKGMTSEELIATIRSVHGGNSFIPPAIAQKLAERIGTEELTPRESEVLEQIVHGKNNREIATELVISETTVKTHINRLLGKLGVTDRTQAATSAIQRGLVPLSRPR
jgi:DNA-binding NarL/FixJ family response regulator